MLHPSENHQEWRSIETLTVYILGVHSETYSCLDRNVNKSIIFSEKCKQLKVNPLDATGILSLYCNALASLSVSLKI